MDSDLVKIEKLQNGEQFSTWKFQVKILLKASDLFDMVTVTGGQRPVPDVDNKWIKADCKAQKVIVTTVGQQPLMHLITCETAREMWTKLESVYEQKSCTNIHLLQQRFYSFNKDPNESVAMCISKLENIVRQLKDFGERISDSMVITKILMVLPPSYSHFYSAWESTDIKQQTLSNLTSRLMMEEARVNSHEAPEMGGALFVNKFSGKPKKKSNTSSSTPARSGKCFYCKQKGHWRSNCPQRKKTTGQNSNYHHAEGDAFISDVQSGENAYVDEDWFMDSGASHHMTHHREWFLEFAIFDKPMQVRMGNGDTICAYGKGNINISAFDNKSWMPKHLSDVLYVPDISLNLFSTNSALDKGLKLVSDKNSCYLTKGGCTVAVGVRQQRLFKLMFRILPPETLAVCANTAVMNNLPLQVWHERFCHQNFAHVKSMLNKFNIKFSDAGTLLCDGCIVGKQHRTSFASSAHRASMVGELVHSDVCGPMEENSIGGSRYFILFKDDFSSYRSVYFIKNKSEVNDRINKFVHSVKTDTGCVVKTLRTDNGTEYVNKDVNFTTFNNFICHQKTVPYSPQQNGRAERDMRTIVEAARSMIHSCGLNKKFWAEAVNCAVYILNRTGPSPVKDKSPYEFWFGKKPSIDHLRVFGCEVYTHVPKEKRRKWDVKSVAGIFVGYCENTKGYRVWNTSSEKVSISRDIVFKEPSFSSNNVRANNKNDAQVKAADTSNVSHKPFSVIQIDNSVEDPDPVAEETSTNSRNLIESNEENISSRLRSKCPSMSCLNVADGYAFVAQMYEPQCYEDALSCSESKRWLEAMDDEIQSLYKNQTWILVDLPVNRKTIGNRWIYKLKHNQAGDIDRFKARLVVRGFCQTYGVDYFETFSPVVKFTSIRMILAIAAAENLKLKQFDVKTAFLYGELDEEIFMVQPKGYDDNSGRVCKLIKSLYGLKQSSRCWNTKFTSLLKQFNFEVSVADPCVFISHQHKRKIILAIYIDDGLVAATDDADISTLLIYLQNNFDIKVFEASVFLGLNIVRKEKCIHVHQSLYAKKVLMKFNMLDANPVSTPADACIQSLYSEHNFVGEIQKFPFREAVGSLMYLAVATRPDISFAISCVSRHLDNPQTGHINAVKRILKYILGTMDYGIQFNFINNNCIVGFSDADYGGDVETRRSTSGFVFMFGNGAISWCSQRQKCVSLSTTESEYVAASQSVKELVWLDQLLKELTICDNIPELNLDNQGAMKLIKNPEFHKRTKHIDIKYHFIREKYEDGLFRLNYVPTDEQLADVFTKPLAKGKFEFFRNKIGVICEQ